MQAFAFNTRRSKFGDPRVRRAFNLAFDFETVNREVFFDQYTRISSHSMHRVGVVRSAKRSRTRIPASGRLRDPARGIHDALPESDQPQRRDVSFEFAGGEALLTKSGLEVEDLVLIDPKTRDQFSVEFLIGNESLERIIVFYKPALERLGMRVTVRLVDDVQYQNRLRDGTSTSSSPHGRKHRRQVTSSGTTGDRVPPTCRVTEPDRHRESAVDGSIERIIFADNREDLVAETRCWIACCWDHYVVPQWNFSKVRTARWDRFSHPERMPKYGLTGFPTLWWSDTAVS